MTAPLQLGGVPEHFNLPWHWAIDELTSSAEPLTLRWTDQPGGTGAMLKGLESGELDLVSILTEGTVAAINRGLPVTILGVYVQSPLQWGVFVPGDSSFAEEADMTDARIAISRFNSGSHLMAFIQAERNGWDLADEKFRVTGGLEGTRDYFANGWADLFLWDQFMTRPLVRSGEFRQLGVQETPWPSFVFAVRNEVLQARTTEVGRVVDAVVRQAASLHDRPGIAGEISARYGLGEDTAQAWLDSVEFALRSAFDPSIATLVLDTLHRAGFR